MRVLLVIGSARMGGAEGQLTRLACELAQRGLDVRVLFTGGDGPLTARLDAAGVPWQVLRRYPAPSSTLATLAMPVRLARLLVTWQPDVVFAWLAAAVWLTLPMTAALTRAKRIAAFRGEVFDRDLRWFARPFRAAVSRAHAVTVNSPSLRAEAIRWGADPDRVTFVPNGVDRPAGTADVAPSPPTAVVVANFRWYKGHDVLVDALALVDEPVTVRLVGEGSEREATRARAVERGVADRLHFVDHPADVAAELRGAQFAIHPSRTEGLSNAILEELAAGLPVVATDVGGTSLLVADGVNGFLVPAGDEHQLAKRISELAASARLRATMSVAARTRSATYDWDACTDSYLRLFQDLVTPARSRS
ncbi:Glycosyltransferase involved in cell wall bisynthesis [Micromonospora auratinigra]|uniref:Glycosyltransferase involved in cell wall bisynthesis n=2 Tax=Micromonospora auratinigra TaxID=261654 RepID=A0A1A8Z1P4_9ACTN|nr:Glycosyltransferase involved in cell wall bisynthesis [Micromonospora auratinigra]